MNSKSTEMKRKNHKWKNVYNILHNSHQICDKCKVERIWIRGDYQCWQYRIYPPDYDSQFDSPKETFLRPQCE